MHAGPIASRFATHEAEKSIKGFAPTTHGRKRVNDHTRIGGDPAARVAADEIKVDGIQFYGIAS